MQTRSGGDTYGSRSLNIITVKRQNNTFRRVREQKRQIVGRMSQVSNEGDAYRARSKGIFKKATDKDIYDYSERSKFQISNKNVFQAGVGVGVW